MCGRRCPSERRWLTDCARRPSRVRRHAPPGRSCSVMRRRRQTMSGRTLTVEDLTKEYDTPAGPRRVLDALSLTAEPGETIAILGPSGSGKSTLLNVIGSLDRPTSGSVQLGDTPVTSLEGSALAGYRAEDVGFIFQDHHLLPQLTATENVLLPTMTAGTGDGAEERARGLLD
ncbi:MAG: ATP-binding cassette domain-containing protein, partial [Armatimonadia bacterium]|nr:ATP-binding cassette domain-containing protein [Armatimonadia bacterium]